MPKNSFLQALFTGPKFSIAPIEQNNRGTVQIGRVVPVFSTILNPREGVTLDMAQLVRFLPAQAPVMEGYKVTFDAFAVPYSCLGYADRKERDIDDFFNLKENAGNIQNPFCFDFGRLHTIGHYGDVSYSPVTGLSTFFRNGSLGDYMNFPSLKSVIDHIRKWVDVNPLAHGDGIDSYFSDPSLFSQYLDAARFVALAFLNGDASHTEMEVDGNSLIIYHGVPFVVSESAKVVQGERTADSQLGNNDSDLYFSSDNQPFEIGDANVYGCYSLLGYILRNYPRVSEYYGLGLRDFDTDFFHLTLLVNENHREYNYDYLQVLYDFYKVDAQSIYDEWFNNCVLPSILYNYDLSNFDGDGFMDSGFIPVLTEKPVDLSYFAAYWKIISDWYINTNIDGDPEDFFLHNCCLLSDEELSSLPARHLNLEPFVRRWPNDIFTSAVPMANVQNVRIPADGTIPDLREANAYQKLVDIFRNTGRRLRDVIYGVFGIRPSAVRSEMSEPIGTISSWIGMQSVLQTSETTPDSPQAAYAGIGTNSDGFKHVLKYVNNAEPTPVIIMVLMSVTQRASYMQGFDRKFFRSSIYDFAVPQLAMIGEQEIQNSELYFDKNYTEGVFGFNRRYYDWFYSGSEVHGEFRGSMDYWHGARIFDSQPALNSEFIGINPETDHLQRVFANVSESSMPVLYNLSFDGYKTVALPRYIQYEL